MKKICLLVFMVVLTVSCAQGGKMDNKTLKLLRKSEKKFNGTYAGKEIDLSNSDMSGMKIKGANFARANLKGANLKDTDFIKSNLGKADLSGAILNNTLFDACEMSEIKFIKTKFSLVFFDGCTIENSDFHESTFEKVKFDNSDLTRSDYGDGIFFMRFEKRIINGTYVNYNEYIISVNGDPYLFRLEKIKAGLLIDGEQWIKKFF